MRFIIPYIAGALSSACIIVGFLAAEAGQLGTGIAFAVFFTVIAAIICFKRHKRKQREYYDRFRSK